MTDPLAAKLMRDDRMALPVADSCACGMEGGAEAASEPGAAAEVHVRRLRLTRMRVGDTGRVCGGRLEEEDREMLRALGLRPDARVRLTRVGEPCIVQVLGRHGCSCRIGLARPLAERVIIAMDDTGAGR
ncbi:MAG: ferrous iron transport protein A [Phycisphaeraceae bacterium]|nr:ferrous iron transport protein A [Phycisphaerales bacterium]MCB9842728.1 ferrous iron transport protein A [Phycisphaeraceae bacterium]